LINFFIFHINLLQHLELFKFKKANDQPKDQEDLPHEKDLQVLSFQNTEEMP